MTEHDLEGFLLKDLELTDIALRERWGLPATVDKREGPAFYNAAFNDLDMDKKWIHDRSSASRSRFEEMVADYLPHCEKRQDLLGLSASNYAREAVLFLIDGGWTKV